MDLTDRQKVLSAALTEYVGAQPGGWADVMAVVLDGLLFAKDKTFVQALTDQLTQGLQTKQDQLAAVDADFAARAQVAKDDLNQDIVQTTDAITALQTATVDVPADPVPVVVSP